MKQRCTAPDAFVAPHALSGRSPDTPVAVALSGGADSVALLHILVKMQHTVQAVHVHHGIRGAEADRDADFCRALTARLGVPLSVLHVDVPALAASSKQSLETAAREARYRAIADWMRKNRLSLLATAHHADDQLETMLQNLLRGAGLRGLCGIPACRPLQNNIQVVRPLLAVPKRDVLAYCTSEGLDYITDSTNAERCCNRNRLRLDVLPLLTALRPEAPVLAARCAQSLSEDEQYLTGLAADFLAREGREPTVAALAALPRPIFVRVMRTLLPHDLTRAHLDALYALVCKGEPHAALAIPPQTEAAIENGRFVIRPTRRTPLAVHYDIVLHEGENPIPEIGGLAVLLRGEASYTPKDSYKYAARLQISSAAQSGPLRVRPRRAGDRIFSGGMHKLVRKLPGLAPLPLAIRACMPLLADDNGLLAVPFAAVRDGAGKHPDTTIFLFFQDDTAIL